MIWSTRIGARIVAAEPVDQLAAMRIGARLFLAECSAPDVQRIVLIDAPAVLGWERWREVGMKYGLGVIEAMLAQAMADGVIPEQPLRPTAHVLLGALDEAALYVSRADDADAALHADVRGVRPCDQRHRRRPLTGQDRQAQCPSKQVVQKQVVSDGDQPLRVRGLDASPGPEGVAPSRPNCAEPPFWAPSSCFCCFWSAPATSRASSNPSPPPASSSCPRAGGSRRRAT